MDREAERIARCAGLAARGALGQRESAREIEETVVATTLRELGVPEREIEPYLLDRYGPHPEPTYEMLALTGDTPQLGPLAA